MRVEIIILLPVHLLIVKKNRLLDVICRLTASNENKGITLFMFIHNSTETDGNNVTSYVKNLLQTKICVPLFLSQ